nr:TOBE domain-containing protein [uncultured Roseateles sp.]
MAKTRRLIGKIEFETPAGAVLGDKRIRLLEAIALHGSLNQAAKAVPLSYKAAWDALDSMNNLAEAPLVVRSTGGLNGGGTQLTEHGRRMIALYRALESSQQDILDQVSSPRALAATAQEAAPLRTLLRRMSVKTSARNQFIGTVEAVSDAGGMADVRLRLDGGDELTAAITPESVEMMALKPGSQAYALIKAPWVGISAVPPRASRTLNRFEGEISALEAGAASTRLTLTTASGRAIAAAMPQALVARRGLGLGQRAWASFATDSVILATFD